MKLCITGYRPAKLPAQYGYDIHNEAWQDLKRAFSDVSLFLYGKDHSLSIYTGMALGVDQAFVEEAFFLRSSLPNIRCIAAIPCYNQESKWPVTSRAQYHEILSQCDEAVYVTKSRFTQDCMELRNQWMVDHSDILVAVYDGKKGGTKNCIDYAEKHGKAIIQINPSTLQLYCKTDIWRLI